MLSPGSSAQTQKLGLNVYMGGVGLQEFFIVSASLYKNGRMTEKVVGIRVLMMLTGCFHFFDDQISS